MSVPSVDKKQKMLEALEYNLGIVSHSCKSANVSRAAHYKWLQEDEDYKKQVYEISESAIDFVEGKLFESIKNNNIAAIMFYLKSKAKHRGYVEKQIVGVEETKEFTVKVIE